MSESFPTPVSLYLCSANFRGPARRGPGCPDHPSPVRPVPGDRRTAAHPPDRFVGIEDRSLSEQTTRKSYPKPDTAAHLLDWLASILGDDVASFQVTGYLVWRLTE